MRFIVYQGKAFRNYGVEGDHYYLMSHSEESLKEGYKPVEREFTIHTNYQTGEKENHRAILYKKTIPKSEVESIYEIVDQAIYKGKTFDIIFSSDDHFDQSDSWVRLLIDDIRFLRENDLLKDAIVFDNTDGHVRYYSGIIPISEVTIVRTRKDLPLEMDKRQVAKNNSPVVQNNKQAEENKTQVERDNKQVEKDKKQISVEEYKQLRKEINNWLIGFTLLAILIFVLGGLLVVQESRYFILLYSSIAVMFALANIGLFPLSRAVQASDRSNPQLRKLKLKGVKVPSHYRNKRLLLLGIGIIVILFTFSKQFDFDRGLHAPEKVKTPIVIDNPSSSSIDKIKGEVQDEIEESHSNE